MSRREDDRQDRHKHDDDRRGHREQPRPRPVEEKPQKRFNPDQVRYKNALDELSNTSKAKLLGESGNLIKEVHVSMLADTLKEAQEGVSAVVLDGIITQRILDLAVEKNISAVVGVKLGNIAKLPTNVEVLTKEDFS